MSSTEWAEAPDCRHAYEGLGECPQCADDEARECLCGRTFHVRVGTPPWAVCIDCMKQGTLSHG